MLLADVWNCYERRPDRATPATVSIWNQYEANLREFVVDFLATMLYFGYVLVTFGSENTRKNRKNRRPPKREKPVESEPEALESVYDVFKTKWGGRRN